MPRLFDLVKTKEEKILPAFYFALRDTLVANDLDQATRIAYGKTRYRVVTLQGQLLDQSGTCVGAATGVTVYNMKSLVCFTLRYKRIIVNVFYLGTMSGGGKTVCRGRMGSSIASEVDPKELNNMENSLEKVCTCLSVNIQ